MYSAFVTLQRVSVEAVAEIAHDNGVVFTHYEAIESPVKLLIADNERNMLDALNEILDEVDSSYSAKHIPEDMPIHITA